MTDNSKSNEVINWIKKISEMETEFFKSVSVIPFGCMCFIHPKDMSKEDAIKQLKKYLKVYVK